jgi:hypothetical protein
MTRHDSGQPSSCRIQIELRQIVEHVDRTALDLDDLPFGSAAAQSPLSTLPRTAMTGATGPRVSKHAPVPTSPRMNDELATAERRDSFIPQQPMCVRDHANHD